jgi:predicted house-cleaning noncanonical NTP pyrophosphatase (MazG superfamily)
MKLVRDKIPEIMESKRQIAKTRIASEEEYLEQLGVKLKEEVNEFLENYDEEELADVLEVIAAIQKAKNIDKNRIENIRKKKVEERGSFDKKIILE